MRRYSLDEKFTKTRDKAFVTFEGWDGKSYNGEGRNLRVYVDESGCRFVRTTRGDWRCYHKILNDKHPLTGANKLDTCVYMSESWY